ncbi:hypothetical protein HaLaN_00968, partial [Haematococcus lacustris]
RIKRPSSDPILSANQSASPDLRDFVTGSTRQWSQVVLLPAYGHHLDPVWSAGSGACQPAAAVDDDGGSHCSDWLLAAGSTEQHWQDTLSPANIGRKGPRHHMHRWPCAHAQHCMPLHPALCPASVQPVTTCHSHAAVALSLGHPFLEAARCFPKPSHSQASTTVRQVAGQGLQRSSEHAAHWGEQVAPAGAVLVAKADSSASQGQGLGEDMAEVSMERHGRAKQLVVFFGTASIGTRGGWGADAVLWACCKVVCRPRGSDQLRGRVALVDEHRTTRVSSALNGKQPCEEELDHEQPTRRADRKPPAGQVDLRLLPPAWGQQRDQPVRGLMWCPVVAPRKPPQAPCSSQEATQPQSQGPVLPLQPSAASAPRLSRQLSPTQHTKAEQAAELSKGKAAKAKPAPQLGRWLDRDCNAALNMQRIGESR